jgi:hypothetical protein
MYNKYVETKCSVKILCCREAEITGEWENVIMSRFIICTLHLVSLAILNQGE